MLMSVEEGSAKLPEGISELRSWHLGFPMGLETKAITKESS